MPASVLQRADLESRSRLHDVEGIVTGGGDALSAHWGTVGAGSRIPVAVAEEVLAVPASAAGSRLFRPRQRRGSFHATALANVTAVVEGVCEGAANVVRVTGGVRRDAEVRP